MSDTPNRDELEQVIADLEAEIAAEALDAYCRRAAEWREGEPFPELESD